MSQIAQSLDWPDAPEREIASAADDASDNEIARLLAITEQPGVVSFAMGLPAEEAFPMAALADASAAVFASEGTTGMQYCPTAGVTALRESVARCMSEMTGGRFTAGNVLITAGAQQALDLIGRELLGPGDTIGVETPTYFGALEAWKPLGLRYQAVSIDADARVSAGGRPPPLAYLQPRFRNPTGSSLDRAQKDALMAFSKTTGMRIIEDDAYAALAFEPDDPDTRAPLIANGPFGSGGYAGDVIYLGTVSKLIAPALRTGWVVARPDTIDRLVAAKQGMDLCCSAFSQHVVRRLLDETIDDDYVERVRAIYRERCERLSRALHAALPSEVRLDEPRGGLFLWLSFPEGWDTSALLEHALAQQVAFYPGRAFFANTPSCRHARLNIAGAPLDAIEEGARRLGRAVAEYARTVSAI